MTDVKKFKFSAALVPALVMVVILSFNSLLTKYVYERSAFYPAFMFLSLGMVLGGIYFALIMFFDTRHHDLSIFKRKIHHLFVIFVVVELLAIIAEFTSNLAISRGPVSLVKVVEGTQPVFALLIALALYPFAPKFFREATDGRWGRKLVLMIVIIVGLAIINFGTKT